MAGGGLGGRGCALAEQLAARARAGESAQRGAGRAADRADGQVLQAGLAAELGAHLEAGEGENRRNG